MITLRDYQKDAIAAVKRDWDAGYTDLLGTCATGGGKSAIFLALLHDELLLKPCRALILAHRKELIEQPIDKLYQYYPEMEGQAGIVMGEVNQPDRPVTVATIQSLAISPKRLAGILGHGVIDYLITDECFVAGTLIDGRPIETIRKGDLTTSFCEQTGDLVAGKVVACIRRACPERLVQISIGDRKVTCTTNHPFFTEHGWKPAGAIRNNEKIYVTRNVDMLSMRQGIYTQKSLSSEQLSEKWGSLLLGGMPEKASIRVYGEDQSQIRQRADEKQKSYALHRDQGKDERKTQSDRTQTIDPGWERQTNPIRTFTSGECSGMDYRIPNTDQSGANQCRASANVLQSGYCLSGGNDSYRGGRPFSFFYSAQNARSEKRDVPTLARVDRVEVFKRGRDPEFEQLCPDGYVYNLEIEGYHTYTANGFVVHNCHHHTDKNTYMSVTGALRDANPALRHLGVTATPIRADGDGLGGVYQRESFHYGIKELIQRGYLVNIRWLAVEAAISLEGVKTVAGEFQRSSLGKVFETDELMRIVVSAYQQYAPERQAIAFSVTVAGAHRLAEAFRAAGVRAEAADGTTDRGLRAAILARFQRGETQVLCNVGLYTEGLDVPQASCILQARPTRSDSLYVQMIGRALRTFPGKDDALIIDFCPVEKRNVVMMGDVLGAPLPVRQLAEKQPKPGAVQLGFTFDGGFTWMDGSPLEIISRQLNYLDTSPWSWYRAQDGWMSIGLGMTGETERVLAITPPGETVKLVGVWRKPGGRWQAATIQEGAMSDILERAEHLCNQYGDAALAARARAWRRDTATDKQIAFARRIGALRAGMSKGELAQSINHTLAMQAIGGSYAR